MMLHPTQELEPPANPARFKPHDQHALNNIYREAEDRYKNEVPPGYMDAKKDKDGPDEYAHGGITYKRRYGDYLVWRQMLDFAKTHGVKTLVFVTDDSKEDWWWVLKSDGPKTLGPRPELVDEALRVGGISSFLMYKPDVFMSYSKDFVAANISTETLQEVRDVSRVRSENHLRVSEFMATAQAGVNAVHKWLEQRFSSVVEGSGGFLDFVASEGTRKFGFVIKSVRSVGLIANRVHEMAYRAHFEVSEGSLDMATVVWIASNIEEAEDLIARMRRRSIENMPRTVRNLVGVLADSGDGEKNFVALSEFSFNDSAQIKLPFMDAKL